MRRLFSLLVVGLAMAPAAYAQSERYPSRPVRLIVPYLAGGAPDVVARVLSQELGTRLGQPFIVENRPGAGGSLATEYVAKSAPDGYTLLVTPDSPLIINPHVFKSIGYDPQKDLEPVSLAVKSSFYVVACPKFQANTMDELAQLAKKRNVTYASSGYGTIMHLSGEAVRLHAGGSFTHVPYKGAPPAMNDVMNCSVDIGFGAYNTVVQFIKSGKMKALAISATARDPETPDVPTAAEAGYPELSQFESPYGLLAPAKTPKKIVELLAETVKTALREKAVVDGFRQRGMAMIDGSPSEYAEYLRLGNDRIGQLVRKSNIQAE